MIRGSMVSTFIAALAISGLAHHADAKERQGTVTVEVKLNAQVEAGDVKVWLPYPMSDTNQDITGVSVSGNYAGMGVYKEPKDGVAALYAEWKALLKNRTLTYTFTVEEKMSLSRL